VIFRGGDEIRCVIIEGFVGMRFKKLKKQAIL